jgi:hypothetical protein
MMSDTRKPLTLSRETLKNLRIKTDVKAGTASGPNCTTTASVMLSCSACALPKTRPV